MIERRYTGNLNAFTQTELDTVRQKSVCVVGCGGLGGFVCNALARFGVGSITVIDGDTFSESNLNRQLFARPDTIGLYKAEVCKNELAHINDELEVFAVCQMLDETNAENLLYGHDIVIDCLDSPQARIVLENACQRLGVVFVHGAIGGFCGQVAAVFPGEGIMKRLYAEGEGAALPMRGNPVFTAQTVAALECGEALKILAGRASELRGRLLLIDLTDYSFEMIRV